MNWSDTEEGKRSLSDTAKILNDVQTAFKNAFPDINVDPSTPQGQLITFITDKLTEAQANMIYFSNAWTNGGSGRFLDSWAQTLYGITRKGSAPAMVDLVLIGLSGTTVPKGFKVCAEDGSNKFTTNNQVTIGSDGMATVSATATDAHQPQVLKNTITKHEALLGLDTVNNTYNSSLSLDEETDLELYQRAIDLSPHFLTSSVFGSSMAQVGDLEGVEKVGGYENVTNLSQKIQGVTLDPHSVNYIVKGGNSQTIGELLLKYKNPGCAMGGNETMHVDEKISGQTYDVKFFRPEAAPLKAEINVKVSPTDSLNYAADISKALQDYINRLPFGSIVYPINVATALKDLNIKILDLKMARVSDETVCYSPIPLTFTEYALLKYENIKVMAG